MPRDKRTNIKRMPPINIDLDDPRQKRLWEIYQDKTRQGIGATWIRDTLIAALPASASTPVYAAPKKPLPFPHPVSGVYVDPEDDVRYEPIDE